eukprot:9471627-Pyramimonas_sp.AAC.2
MLAVHTGDKGTEADGFLFMQYIGACTPFLPTSLQHTGTQETLTYPTDTARGCARLRTDARSIAIVCRV